MTRSRMMNRWRERVHERAVARVSERGAQRALDVSARWCLLLDTLGLAALAGGVVLAFTGAWWWVMIGVIGAAALRWLSLVPRATCRVAMERINKRYRSPGLHTLGQFWGSLGG